MSLCSGYHCFLLCLSWSYVNTVMKARSTCVPSRRAEDIGVKGTFEMDPRREVCVVFTASYPMFVTLWLPNSDLSWV